jgi:hypothetical protein
MVKNIEIIEAFINNRKDIKTKNLLFSESSLFLFNNKIAEKTSLNTFKIMCPYISRTTLKILNLLPNVKVNIKNRQLFLNNNIWNGNEMEIKNESNDEESE